jgi:hypothetical protein
MSFISEVTDFLSDGLGGQIANTVKAYFPPSMTEAEKVDLELRIEDAVHKKTTELLKLAHEERAQFNEQIKSHEGTAKDLQQFGWIGKLIVFLRGCQRPVWGYLTLYMDIMWFSGKWSGLTQQQESALWVVNILVLGFLFGERAIKNVMPVITEMMKQKVGK